MTLKEALINKGNTDNEANQLILEMKDRIFYGDDPEELLYEEGLEADYVMDLLEECL